MLSTWHWPTGGNSVYISSHTDPAAHTQAPRMSLGNDPSE